MTCPIARIVLGVATLACAVGGYVGVTAAASVWVKHRTPEQVTAKPKPAATVRVTRWSCRNTRAPIADVPLEVIKAGGFSDRAALAAFVARDEEALTETFVAVREAMAPAERAFRSCVAATGLQGSADAELTFALASTGHEVTASDFRLWALHAPADRTVDVEACLRKHIDEAYKVDAVARVGHRFRPHQGRFPFLARLLLSAATTDASTTVR